MCQREEQGQAEEQRFEISGGPGELDVMYSLLREEPIVFNVVTDDHANDFGSEPEVGRFQFVILGFWRLQKKDDGYRGNSTYGFLAVNMGRMLQPNSYRVTGEYCLRTRQGWLTPCAADAKVTVSDGGPVMFYGYTAKPGA